MKTPLDNFHGTWTPSRGTHQVIARTRVYSMALDCVREVDNVRVSRCSSHRRYYRLKSELNLKSLILLKGLDPKLTTVHLIGTVLAGIGPTAAQRHAAVGARSLGRLHHLFVLGPAVLEPDFHLQAHRLECELALILVGKAERTNARRQNPANS